MQEFDHPGTVPLLTDNPPVDLQTPEESGASDSSSEGNGGAVNARRVAL
jgi:hypothetical protein